MGSTDRMIQARAGPAIRTQKNFAAPSGSQETLEKVLNCYQLTIEDISDRLVEFPEKDDDLDDLIGGL